LNLLQRHNSMRCCTCVNSHMRPYLEIPLHTLHRWSRRANHHSASEVTRSLSFQQSPSFHLKDLLFRLCELLCNCIVM
jgi:hypothetical protein